VHRVNTAGRISSCVDRNDHPILGQHPVVVAGKDMRMNVDKSGSNVEAADVDNLSRLRGGDLVQVLLTTDNPTSDAPLAWLGLHPKARVIYIQLGHGSAAHRNPNYQRLVRNAIVWAAGR
jgi:type 1 glutamine amidotransferase